MKTNRSAYIGAIALFAVLNIVSEALAQQPHYKLIDVGTFGGPQSYLNNGNDGNNSATVLNNRGTLAGWADTPTPDPFPSFCFDDDCFVSHAFQWHAGVRSDLGALTDGVSSQANWISASGLIAGVSENGEIDPLIPLPEFRAVLWRNGHITDLGTLPEGGYESFANAVNGTGQVIGGALNTVPDPNSLVGPGFYPTQTRAFLWEHGVMQDLGTLGGTDAMAQFINERGQVVGLSYTSSAPNTSCPFFLPLALGSFIWDEKSGMRNLGTLGGTCAVATGVNNAGIVIGDNVNDEPIQRAFLWDNGSIKDLGGTIGGNQAAAEGVNQSGQVAGGEIAGFGLDVDNNPHAFLLIPCGANGPSDCQEEIVSAGASQPGVVSLTRHPQVGSPTNSVRRMLRPRLGPVPHFLTPRSGLAGGRVFTPVGNP